MSLKLYARPNGIFHIRGTVQGRRVDESARTRIRDEAEEIRAKLEADLHRRAVYGDDAVATFAEAAEGYMLAGGESEHLTPLILHFGLMKLRNIKQIDIDRYVQGRRVKPATLIRQVYTPMSAVLTHASRQGLCAKPDLRKPEIKTTRTEHLTPDQAEAWIKALPPYLSRLVTFYLSTGCRASEALNLQWKDVSPDAHRVVLWETKAGYSRSVDLQRRAIKAIGQRHDLWFERIGDDGKIGRINPVFLNSRSEPWHGYDAINLMLKRHCERLGKLDKPVKLEPAHCHLFRHTWATWAYACTRDLTFLMQQGGWRSLTLLGRYTHAGSPDLATAVKAHGWEFLGREVAGLAPKPRKR